AAPGSRGNATGAPPNPSLAVSDSRQKCRRATTRICVMHRVLPLKVHYYGTPVVLVSSTNPDGTTNLAPMSSAWWLGQNAMLGLAAASRTTQNLLRTGEAVLNLASADMVDHVDRLALLTGSPELSPHK